MKTKILAISDLHGKVNQLKKAKHKEADFLFVVGDLSNIGLRSELTRSLDMIDGFDHIQHKVVVLGNHDARNLHNPLGMNDDEVYSFCEQEYPNLTFLKNKIVEIDGLKIYGTPFVGKFGGWAFQCEENEKLAKTIPTEKVDIILCHEPPSAIELSKWEDIDIGNIALREYLDNNKVGLLVCGHVHESGGNQVNINGCECYNVAMKLTKIILER
ncbi:MAG: metallophosphoesterase family protein [Fusobacteriaceae bacterium]